MTEGTDAAGPLAVVPVDQSNWKVYRDVRLTMLREAPRAFWTTYDEAAARTDEQWQRLVATSDTWLALRAGRALGSVASAGLPGQADERVLVGMWVDPAGRGQGVGEALVRTVLEHAAANGMRRVLLDVAHENAPARGLYERMGFAPTGRTDAMPHDPTITELQMERVVAPVADPTQGAHTKPT